MPSGSVSNNFRKPSWLSPESVFMLREQMGIPEAHYYQAESADSDKAASLVVALCFIRLDAAYRQQITAVLKDYASMRPALGAAALQRAAFQPLATDLLFVTAKVMQDAQAYPFALSDAEFAANAVELFGGEMRNVERTYRPPSYYGEVMRLVINGAMSAMFAAGAAAFLPEVGAGAALAMRMAPAMAKSGVGFVSNNILNTVNPSKPLAVARKNRLWVMYQVELRRRSIP